MTTIIFIPGNNTSKSLDLVQRSNWEELLKQEFPGMSVNMTYSPYDMWDKDKVNKTVDQIVEEINTINGEIVLFGYSFGGLITRLVYQKLNKPEQDKIKAIITMGTPHQVPNKKQRKFVQNVLGLSSSIDVPILAITGYFDLFAMPIFTRLAGAKMKTKSFFCTHPDFFYSKNIRNKVVKEIKIFFTEYSIH